MRSSILTAILLLLLAAFPNAPGARGEEGAEDEIRTLLELVKKDAGDEAWVAAVASLRDLGDDAVERLERILGKLLRKHLKSLTSVSGRIDELAGDRREEDRASATAREAWETTSRSAREFIFDRERFPDASGVPLVSPGWDTAARLGTAAQRTFDEIAGKLDRALSRFLALEEEDARELRAEHTRTKAAHDRVACALGVESEAPAVRFDSWLLLDLAEGNYSGAAKLIRTLPPSRSRLIAYHAYCRRIMSANEPLLRNMKRTSARGMDRINRYRMALGHSPLSLSEPLVEAALGHSREMRDLAYFSHDSPIAERRTEGDRARLAGYTASVWENIYANPSMMDAIPVWEKSARHHRAMTSPKLTEAGVGADGPCVLLLGDGARGSPPGIVY